VWLDGLEITQFTYFQQAGGQMLDPPSVEITYGMERILMALQGVRHFKDIVYAPGVTYGDLFGQAEYEMSRYYLDDADVALNRGLLDMYAGEAERAGNEAGTPCQRPRPWRARPGLECTQRLSGHAVTVWSGQLHVAGRCWRP